MSLRRFIAAWFGGRERAELVVLRLLQGSPEMLGLDLVKASHGDLGRGTIYVHLARMEDQGLIASRPERFTRPEIGIVRRLYRITDEGRWRLLQSTGAVQ